MVNKFLLLLGAGAALVVGAVAASKAYAGGGITFLCRILTSSGVVASLPAGATSNGSVDLSYVQQIGGTCAAGGEYLYVSPADAATLGVGAGYWYINAGGSGGLTLTTQAQVAPGGTLTFSGTGYTPNGTVEINASGAGFFQVYPTVKASAAGVISGSVVIPSGLPSESAELAAGDEGTGRVQTATFTIT